MLPALQSRPDWLPTCSSCAKLWRISSTSPIAEAHITRLNADWWSGPSCSQAGETCGEHEAHQHLLRNATLGAVSLP